MTAAPPRIEVRSVGDPRLADHVPAELQAAKTVAQDLCSLLDVDLGNETVSILMVPFMPLELRIGAEGQNRGSGHGQDQGSNRADIVRMVGPDGDAPPLPLSLTIELIERAFGSAEPVVSVGLAGVVAGRTGTGPAVEDLRKALLVQAAESGVEVGDLLSSAFGDESSKLSLDIWAAATCFVNHLLSEFGKARVSRYLEMAAEQRRDEAAMGAFGRPLPQLVREWSATASDLDEVTKPLRGLWRHVKGIAAGYRWRFAELMSYVLVSVALTVIMPLTTKYLIDKVLPGRDTQRLAVFVAVLFVVYVYRSVLSLRTAYVSSLLDLRIFFALQQRMFSHIQRLSHEFHHRTAVGDLMSRMSNDLRQGQQALGQLAVVPLPATLNLVASSITVFVLDWRFGLVVLVTVPLLAAIYRIMSPRIRDASLRQQRAMGAAMGTLQESLAGQSALKAFGATGYAERGYASRVNSMFGTGMRMAVYGAGLESAVGFITTLPLLAVLGIGGYEVTQGAMSLGTLVAILGLLPNVVQPVTELAKLFETLQSSSGAVRRITELLDEPVTVEDPVLPAPTPRLTDAVSLRDVTFSYDRGGVAVGGVSLELPAGTHTAIVGPSGSGKSTLLAMLIRFYDPQQGSITIDGVDLRDLSLDDLRGRVGLVSQDTVLFDATLRENIVLGRPGVTDDDIASAVTAAQLGAFVRSLPEGLDTLMGERAARLSGGQRQRVGIARALLRKPALLLLDEPTSALDRDVEQQVLATLAEAAAGRTTVTVTHRVDTVSEVDNIVVMSGGRIVEAGRHHQLLAHNGVYAGLLRHGGVVDRRALSAVSLFADVPAEGLAALEDSLRREHVPSGDAVVVEGGPADAIYVIESGRAEVTVTSGSLVRRIRVLGPGDAFGELALAGESHRTATVRALEELGVAVLPVEAYRAVAARLSGVQDAVEHAVARRREVYEEVTGVR